MGRSTDGFSNFSAKKYLIDRFSEYPRQDSQQQQKQQQQQQQQQLLLRLLLLLPPPPLLLLLLLLLLHSVCCTVLGHLIVSPHACMLTMLGEQNRLLYWCLYSVQPCHQCHQCHHVTGERETATHEHHLSYYVSLRLNTSAETQHNPLHSPSPVHNSRSRLTGAGLTYLALTLGSAAISLAKMCLTPLRIDSADENRGVSSAPFMSLATSSTDSAGVGTA